MNIEEYIKAFTSGISNPSREVKELIDAMPQYIKQNSYVKSFKRNEFLYHKEEETNHVYYVIEGSYVVVNEFESGKIYEPIILHNNDFIGVVEVIMNFENIITTIVANEDMTVFQFSSRDFNKWLNESHELNKIVLKAVSTNFIKNMKMSGEGIILDTKYLLISHLLQNSTPTKDGYELDESREKTSKRTGINLRTLYRHIKELKNQDLVISSGRKLRFDEVMKENLYTLYIDLRNK